MNTEIIRNALYRLTGRNDIKIASPLSRFGGLDVPHGGTLSIQRIQRDMLANEFEAAVPDNVASVVDALKYRDGVNDGSMNIADLPMRDGGYWFFYPGIRLELERKKSHIKDVLGRDGRPVMIELQGKMVRKTTVVYESYAIQGIGLVSLVVLTAFGKQFLSCGMYTLASDEATFGTNCGYAVRV